MPRPFTLYRLAAIAFSILATLPNLNFSSVPTRAQNPPPQAIPASSAQQDVPRLKVDVGLVLFEASVWNMAGGTMDTLNREDFALLDDGVPQSIVHFSRDELPLAVVLVVDVSGSMADVMGSMRKAALAWLERLKPVDRVAIFTFADNPKLQVPLTLEKAKVAKAIGQFSASGGTDIHKALYQAAAYLRQEAPHERRIVILASDDFAGTFLGGRISSEVLRSLQEADTTLYNLKLRNLDERFVPHERLELMDVVHVPWIAAQTGGVVEEVKNTKQLSEAFGRLIAVLKSRYTLGFYPKMDAGDTGFHKLDLRLTPGLGAKNKDYKILSKDGYFAAPAH
jgi:Ca-activated chloride channel family protein